MPEKKVQKKEETAGMQLAGGGKTAVIWLGPAISGVVIPGTVYRNGLTPQMEKAVSEQPALKRLLVPVREAAKVRRELKDPQSAVCICYNNALKYVRKGAKE